MSQAHYTLQSLKAEDIMTREPVTVNLTDTVQDAADLMLAANVRHIPVVTHRTLVGMISDRDLRSYMLPRPERILHADEARASMAVNVGAVMRPDVVTVLPDAPAVEVIDLLVETKVGAVPVLAPETGDHIGMVSYIDVLRAVRPFF
jgi:CBS domain-containing protein